jgi:hypothetical protein
MDLQPNASDRTRHDAQAAAAQGIADLSATFAKLASLCWDNPYGLTPQQAFDAIGTDGAVKPTVLFSLAAKAGELLAIVGVNLPSPVPAGATVTPNPDGSVTITLPPPVEEPATQPSEEPA